MGLTVIEAVLDVVMVVPFVRVKEAVKPIASERTAV